MSDQNGTQHWLYQSIFEYSKAVRVYRWHNCSTPFAEKLIEKVNGQFHYWVHILLHARDLWGIDPRKFEEDSIQNQIFKADPEGKLKSLFLKARQSAWKVIVEEAETSLLWYRPKSTDSLKTRERHRMARSFARDSKLAKKIGESMLVDSYYESDGEFLALLSEKMENQKPPTLDPRKVAMARLWVHPRVPLWLMKSEDGATLVEQWLRASGFPDHDFSAKDFYNYRERLELEHPKSAPVKGIKLHRDSIFEVSIDKLSSVFEGINLEEFPPIAFDEIAPPP